jgi:alkylhydroperoxidase family enzyme
MPADIFPHTTPELSAARKKLTPDIHDAFTAFSERVFSEGALPVKTKQLIAVAAAHITQCPYCIRVAPRRRCGTGRRRRRSWKRSGSRRRCARAARTPTRSLLLMPSRAPSPGRAHDACSSTRLERA